jgi:hypothetical protein
MERTNNSGSLKNYLPSRSSVPTGELIDIMQSE